jgi:hypothetical protein
MCRQACVNDCVGYNWNNSKKVCTLNSSACDSKNPITKDKKFTHYVKTCV